MGDLDLRLGDWRTVLADVGEVDAVITDPPYSRRVESGFRSSTDPGAAVGLGYAPVDAAYCAAFVGAWAPRNRGWFVVFSDHQTQRGWEAALCGAGLYVFAPLAMVKDQCARLTGDGPCSSLEWITVARPKTKEFLSWGSLPGWYRAETVRHGHGYLGVTGAKSIDLMRAIIRDYTRPGDLVADPHCGSGTTLRACAIEGRRCVSAEIDPKTYKIAADRLRGWGPEEQNGTRNLFAGIKP